MGQVPFELFNGVSSLRIGLQKLLDFAAYSGVTEIGGGGVDRVTFQMDNAELPREKLLRSIELIGERIKPALSAH